MFLANTVVTRGQGCPPLPQLLFYYFNMILMNTYNIQDRSLSLAVIRGVQHAFTFDFDFTREHLFVCIMSCHECLPCCRSLFYELIK